MSSDAVPEGWQNVFRWIAIVAVVVVGLTAIFLTRQGRYVGRGTSQQAESTIRAIVPVGDERSRMMEVRIAMRGAGWPIGSAVRVDLPAAQQAAGLLVPRDAVIVRADGAHVYRIGKDDVAERVAVRVGNGDSRRVEITGALAVGDRVVVRGGERLRAGQTVTIATSGAPAKAAATPASPRG
jgi:hypothetical protein